MEHALVLIALDEAGNPVARPLHEAYAFLVEEKILLAAEFRTEALFQGGEFFPSGAGIVFPVVKLHDVVGLPEASIHPEQRSAAHRLFGREQGGLRSRRCGRAGKGRACALSGILPGRRTQLGGMLRGMEYGGFALGKRRGQGRGSVAAFLRAFKGGAFQVFRHDDGRTRNEQGHEVFDLVHVYGHAAPGGESFNGLPLAVQPDAAAGLAAQAVGAVMTIISALVCVPYCFMSSGNATVIMCIAEVIQVVVLCWTIVPTERALKDNFDQDGNRKDK